jgi:hypothetical protein
MMQETYNKIMEQTIVAKCYSDRADVIKKEYEAETKKLLGVDALKNIIILQPRKNFRILYKKY